MNPSLDLDRIAAVLGAERSGTVNSRGGYFGAVQLAAEVSARIFAQSRDVRPADSICDEQRLIRLSATTLERLENLAKRTHESPMQIAESLLEQAVQSAAVQE